MIASLSCCRNRKKVVLFLDVAVTCRREGRSCSALSAC